VADNHCPTGWSCVSYGGQSFCSKKCNQGSTECPRYADCKDVGGGSYYCVHKAGKCTGTGALCDPCNQTLDCATGAMCLHYTGSKESFCTKDCSSATCPSGYQCYSSPSGSIKSQCVPDQTTKTSCVSSYSNMYEKGDVMEDFAITGKWDSDKDGDMSDEKLAELKLSQFSSTHKVILFDSSAMWCGPCITETRAFANWMKTYEPQGLMIFQTITDGPTKGTRATLPQLDSWISTYNAVGAIGLDWNYNASQFNINNAIPMNVLVDAKTLKVIDKWNGGDVTAAEAKIKSALGL